MQKIKILFLLIITIFHLSNLTSAVDGLVLGFLHQKIVERNVPELKKFNEKITQHFRENNLIKKEKLKKEIENFGNSIIFKLKKKLNKEKLTIAEKDAISIATQIINNKLEKLK